MSPHKSPSKNAQTTPDELRGQGTQDYKGCGERSDNYLLHT